MFIRIRVIEDGEVVVRVLLSGSRAKIEALQRVHSHVRRCAIENGARGASRMK